VRSEEIVVRSDNKATCGGMFIFHSSILTPDS